MDNRFFISQLDSNGGSLEERVRINATFVARDLRVWVVKFQFRRRLISYENCTRQDLRGVIWDASMRPIYLLRVSSSSTFLFRGWVKRDLFLLGFLKMLPFVSFPFYPYQEMFRKCKAGVKNRQQSGFPRPESPTPRGVVFYTGMLFPERLTTTCFMTCCYCHAIDIRYLLFSWLSILEGPRPRLRLFRYNGFSNF